MTLFDSSLAVMRQNIGGARHVEYRLDFINCVLTAFTRDDQILFGHIYIHEEPDGAVCEQWGLTPQQLGIKKRQLRVMLGVELQRSGFGSTYQHLFST